MTKKLKPMHPGEVLREEFLIALKMSAGALAKACGLPRTRIERIASEQTGITADTALRRAEALDTTHDQAIWDRLDEKDRPALLRLATYPVMLTDVRPKLPRDKEILSVFSCPPSLHGRFFPTQRRQPQSRKAFNRWAGFWLDGDRWSRRRDASELLWETCEGLAIKLAYAIDATISDDKWSRLWRGRSRNEGLRERRPFFLAAANCLQSISRRTGDPTITRKPGPNGTALTQEITGLRQEVTALRQKVTVLEQELARQRAIA